MSEPTTRKVIEEVYEVTKKDGKPLGYFHDLEVAKQFVDWRNKNDKYQSANNQFAFYMGMLVGVLACIAVTYMTLAS